MKQLCLATIIIVLHIYSKQGCCINNDWYITLLYKHNIQAQYLYNKVRTMVSLLRRGYTANISFTGACFSSNHVLLLENVLDINSLTLSMSGEDFPDSVLRSCNDLLCDSSSSSNEKRIAGYGCLYKSSFGFLALLSVFFSFGEGRLMFWHFVYKNCFHEC